jgi:hypothetical protein
MSTFNRCQIADALAEANRYTKAEHSAWLASITSRELAAYQAHNHAFLPHIIRDAIKLAKRIDGRFELWDFRRAIKEMFDLRDMPAATDCLAMLDAVDHVRAVAGGAWEVREEPRRTYGIINKIWGA